MLSATARRAPRLVAPAQTRSAVSVAPQTRFGGKSGARVYDERKTFLYDTYARLFRATAGAPLLFLHHKDFSAPRLIKLRRDLAEAVARHARTAPPSLAAPVPAKTKAKTKGVPAPPATPKITMLTSGIFGAALRDHAPVNADATRRLAELLPRGGLALLTLPTLDPGQLAAVLRALERSAPVPKPGAAAATKAPVAAATPGRRAKRVRTPHTPELRVLGAVLDGRVFAADGIKTVSALPTLPTLHAQLVGLLSAPAAQLSAVLSQASGGQLARTLEGFKKGLEEAAAQPEPEQPQA